MSRFFIDFLNTSKLFGKSFHIATNIEGVSGINLSGATSQYLEVLFDPAKMAPLGISVQDLSNAISRYTTPSGTVGKVSLESGSGNTESLVLLTGKSVSDIKMLDLGIINGRIVRLEDVATINLKEHLPSFYYRINGLNTINLTVYPEKYINTIKVTENVKTEIARLAEFFPEKYSYFLVDDASEYIKSELDKIYLRTILSVLILLAFVLVVSRNIRYVAIILITLAANILIAFIFYNILNLELHLYSLAGITVSLGIIIDTSIIMIDHYGYYGNRKIFIAILAALLTSIASLSVVFLLPEQQRANLIDFAAVIIINLTVSLFIAFMFIPSLMNKINIRKKLERHNPKSLRRVIKVTDIYRRYLLLGRRFVWIFICMVILGFGLPVFLLPDKVEVREGKESGCYVRLYNSTIGSPFYQEKLKKPIETALGGSLRLFINCTKNQGWMRSPERPELIINAGMPEGCTVQQLNEVMLSMENYLTQFKQIDIFRTTISGYDNGRITVSFKETTEHTGFPLYLKGEVFAQAANYGGANWSVYGIDENAFNNNVTSSYKPHQITLTGYNYDQLYAYTEQLRLALEENRRVSGLEILGEVSWGRSLSRNEMYMDMEQRKLALYGLGMNEIYGALNEKLYDRQVGRYFTGQTGKDVYLASNESEVFDLWHVNNEYITMDSLNVKLSDLGYIGKRRSGNDIYRDNQQYRLFVAFDFIGNHSS